MDTGGLRSHCARAFPDNPRIDFPYMLFLVSDELPAFHRMLVGFLTGSARGRNRFYKEYSMSTDSKIIEKDVMNYLDRFRRDPDMQPLRVLLVHDAVGDEASSNILAQFHPLENRVRSELMGMRAFNTQVEFHQVSINTFRAPEPPRSPFKVLFSK